MASSTSINKEGKDSAHSDDAYRGSAAQSTEDRAKRSKISAEERDGDSRDTGHPPHQLDIAIESEPQLVLEYPYPSREVSCLSARWEGIPRALHAAFAPYESGGVPFRAYERYLDGYVQLGYSVHLRFLRYTGTPAAAVVHDLTQYLLKALEGSEDRYPRRWQQTMVKLVEIITTAELEDALQRDEEIAMDRQRQDDHYASDYMMGGQRSESGCEMDRYEDEE